jgi:hypothetical protein
VAARRGILVEPQRDGLQFVLGSKGSQSLALDIVPRPECGQMRLRQA